MALDEDDSKTNFATFAHEETSATEGLSTNGDTIVEPKVNERGIDVGEPIIADKPNGTAQAADSPDLPAHKSVELDVSVTDTNFLQTPVEKGCDLDYKGCADDIVKEDKLTANESIVADNNAGQQQKSQREFKKSGWLRHYVAILALIGIVLANMNRQAFNQALVRMSKKRAPMAITITTTTISTNNLDTLATVPSTIMDLSSSTTAMSYISEEKFQLDQKRNDIDNNPDPTIFVPNNIDTSSTTEAPTVQPIDDRFDWTSQQIGQLQSAFSYGYVPLMVFSARISELYGAKWVIFMSGFGSALCCVLSPFFADTEYSYTLLIVSRVAMGLCQTGVSPALYALLVRWLPREESSVYLPMMKAGATLGFTFGSLIPGFFTWRQTFYIVGGIGFLFSIIWPLTVESDPKESKLIKQAELKYINQEISLLNKDRKQSIASSRRASAPWAHILLHPVVLTFMFTKLTVKMSTDAQTQQFNMYLDNVFRISDELNAFLNGLNYALQALFTGVVAYTAQQFVLNKKFGLSKTGVRKLFQGICNFGMGLSYILITFNMSSMTVVCAAYFLLSVSAMFGAGGEAVLPVDLTTDFAATIMSIANLTANLSGIILPRMVASILGDDRTSTQSWNLIWWIVGGMMIAGGLLFTTFVRAELLEFEENRLIKFFSSKFGSCLHRKRSTREKDKISSLDGQSAVVIQMKKLT